MKLFILLLISFLFLIAVIEAQKLSPVETIRAVKISSAPPVIDGELNDEAWKDVPGVNNFKQRELTEGAEATEKTEVRIIYDDDNLYLGIWCYDSKPQSIVSNELARDFSYGTDDNIKIIIDTYHDKRNGFLFIHPSAQT